MHTNTYSETYKLRRAVEAAKAAPVYAKIGAIEALAAEMLAWCEALEKRMEALECQNR